jgi:hypothetical protein
MGPQTRTFIVAFISIGLFATAVQAADTSPIVGQLPDDEDSYQVYLFQLKKNGISLGMSGQQFCTMMKYGKCVCEDREKIEVSKDDHKEILEGDLEWVICRFNRTR